MLRLYTFTCSLCNSLRIIDPALTYLHISSAHTGLEASLQLRSSSPMGGASGVAGRFIIRDSFGLCADPPW